MGSVVQANCRCGHEQTFLIGGGMANFETVCLFPTYCRACRSVGNANLFDSPPACESCASTDVVPYDSDELRGSRGRRTVASWHVEERLGRILRLTDGRYLCPACGEMRLRFASAGHWD